jgi:hypothetical protein
MDRNLVSGSAWKVVLDDPSLWSIGCICTLWAFIDINIDLMLQTLHQIDPDQLTELVGDKMLGSKVDLLKRAADRASNKDAGIRLKNLCDRLKPLAADRNHIVHGTWGYEMTKVRGQMRISKEPRAQSNKGRQAFPSSRLPRLLKQTADVTAEVERVASEFLPDLANAPMPVGGRTIYFGSMGEDEPAPKAGEERTIQFEGRPPARFRFPDRRR